MRPAFRIACLLWIGGLIAFARSAEPARPAVRDQAAEDQAAEEQAADEQWADDQLTKLVDDPRLVVPAYDQSVLEAVRFEYSVVYDLGKPTQRQARWLKENRGVSLMRANGDIVQQSRVWTVGIAPDEPDDAAIREFRGAFEWTAAQADDLRTLPGYNPQPLRFVRVDLSRILKDLRDRSRPRSVDRRNLSITFPLDDGSTAVLRLSRERSPDSFPMEFLSMRGVDGVVSTLCGFDTFAGSTFFPVNTCTPSIPTLMPTGDAKSAEPLTTDDAKARLKRSVKYAFERSDGEPMAPGLAARTAARRAANPNYFTAEEHQSLAKWIAAVGVRSGDAGFADVEALSQLRELLVRRIVEPVRVQRVPPGPHPQARKDTERPPTWLTGHLRRRAVDRLQALTDLDVPEALYSALELAILDRASPPEVRRGALDLLGEIGVPMHHRLLVELERGLADDPDPHVRTLLASVQARTGTASPDDACRLHAAVRSSDTPENVRLIALEGLLLLDDAAGLDDLVAAKFRDATDEIHDLNRRTAFAAGCSNVGRAMLAKIVAAGPSDPAFKRALFLAHTSIRPGDSAWPVCLEAAEAVALDPGADWELRVKASEIAWQGGGDRPFHDRFVRQAILSADALRFDRTGWRYLALRSGGQRYLPELLVLLDSNDVEKRRWAGFCIRRSAVKAVHDPQEQAALLYFMTRLAEDSDETVREEARTLWRMFRAESPRAFADSLLPKFVRTAREEVDPVKFAQISTSIARGLDRKLPVNLISTGTLSTWRELSVEEKTALVRMHRPEIQATLDQWATELTPDP
jgi:HEAT repeat protein